MADGERAKIEVDLAALLVCKCGYALEPTQVHGLARHPIRWGAAEGQEIECEYAGKYFRTLVATLEEVRPEDLSEEARVWI